MTEEVSNDTATSVSEDETYVPGLDLLKSQFVEKDESPPTDEDDDTSPPKDELLSEDPPKDDEDDSPKESEESPQDDLDDETVRRVLAQANVQTALRSVAAQQESTIRANLKQELQLERQTEDESLLSDEELGQRKRRADEMAGPLNVAKQDGYNTAQQDFMNLGIADVWNHVEELKGLSETDRQSLNPKSSQFKSMGEYISALVDKAADIRAEKLVEKKARSMADVLVQEEMREFREKQPNPDGVSGPSSPPDKNIDYEGASGLELLKRAFDAH